MPLHFVVTSAPRQLKLALGALVMGNSLSDEYIAREAKRAEDAVLAKREAREDEIVSIAREANRIASRAERWAMYAAIAAVIALIISITNRIS